MAKLTTTSLIALTIACVLVGSAIPAQSQSCQSTEFFQGFETDNVGWFTPTRVASGSNNIASSSGDWHAEAGQDFTRWGGYNSTFPTGGYTTSIDIYLDLSATSTNDTRFDFISAISNPLGGHRRDFTFNAGFYNDGGEGDRFVISASNNSGRGNSFPKNPARDPLTITSSGWYTFQHHFYDNGSGVLAVDMTIFNASGTALNTWTLSDPSDIIGTTVGGNRYGWFPSNEFDFLAIDNTYRSQAATPPSVDAGEDQTVYNGYGPMSCATLTATPAGESYLWSPGGATTQSITVCPTETTTYTVTVTDENGCTGSDQVTVHVIDVRCGNNGDKVVICHNGQESCVSSNSVQAHLAHGDNLGPCPAGKRTIGGPEAAEQLVLSQNHPNPFSSTTTLDYVVNVAGQVRMDVFSSSGERVHTLVEEYRDAGHYSVEWNGSDNNGIRLPSGRYIVRLSSEGFLVQQQVTLQK